MADELDEGLADEEAVATLRSDEVAESKRRVEEADEDAGEELPSPLAASPAGELVIPAGCQKLLAVRLSYKLGNGRNGRREGRVTLFIWMIYREDSKELH